MTIQEQLQNDLKEAMRARDTERSTTLRMALATMKNLQIELGHPLSDEEALEALRREAKKRRDAVDAYKKAGRDDLAVKEEQELTILEAYLPRQLSAEELRPLVAATAAELGASGPQDMGQLMPVLMARYKDQADGRTISQVAREVLSRG